MAFSQKLWAHAGVLSALLLPLAALFGGVTLLRRTAYRRGWLKAVAIGVPVVIVGNITAGGSGKTPLVIWLVNWLHTQGFRPGVVSRGYGGTAQGCVSVSAERSAREVGDEPLLIHLKTDAPVVIGRDRVAAARTLLARHPGVDIIIADDGMQHYRLHRDLELAVIDAATGLGNGWLLPAGPLREPRSRLRDVDAVIQVVRGAAPPRVDSGAAHWRADYSVGRAYRLLRPEESCDLDDLPRREWQAVTGIGRPQGFFDLLAARQIRFRPRAFPDHHVFRPTDVGAGEAVLMTEKDAVKCVPFAGTEWWAVQLEVAPEAGFIDWLRGRLK